MGWEVNGSGKEEKKIEKVVQVKVGQDPKNANVDVITKTTFLRDNIVAQAKNLYA